MKLLITTLLVAVMLAGCASTRQQNQKRTETLDRYEASVRWGQFHVLVDFMHPDWLEENPISPLDVDRLSQFQVSQYRIRQVVTTEDESGVDRVVELRLYNRHTATERVVLYAESWRYDEERERWMLHSGLPDVTQAR